MAALTVNGVETRVRMFVRDSAETFITDAMVLVWANDAQTDIGSRIGDQEAVATGTMGGAGTSVANGTIDHPSGLTDVITLRLEEDDVEFVPYDEFYAWEDSGASPEHTIAHSFDGVIYLYPKPASAQAYTLRYRTQPTELTAGADTLSVPIEHHPRVAHYVTAMACYADESQALGDHFMALYEDGLPPRHAGRKRMFPGPLTIRRELGVFDADEEAQHN